MSHDQETYRRAANATLIGLAVQAVLAVLTGLTGLYAGSVAVHAITWYIVGGLPIWIILWLIYNQHRLERVEALEAEQLAAEDAQAAALFDEAGQQLNIARKRLDNLYKYGLGAVSILIAAYLLAVGGTMLYQALSMRDAGSLELAAFDKSKSAGVVIILASAIAFIGFLVSRYVAGMTKVNEWKLLRGGAGYLVGNVFTLVLMLASAIYTAIQNDTTAFSLLAIAAPGIMVLLGTELLLNLIFGFYQPKRPGQVSRPAFDSRILGWLTSPESLAKIIGEAVNYQFGIEVSDSWFYRLLSKAITPLVVVGLLVLIGLSSMVMVAPHERAVITHMGALSEDSVVDPGLHWKLPWPLGRAYKYDAYRVHELAVGSSAKTFRRDIPVLWTNQHHTGEGEEYMVTAPSQVASSEDDRGENAAAAELAGGRGIVKYRIAEGGLLDYSRSASDPVAMLEALSERRFNVYFATHDIDLLLSDAWVDAGDKLRGQIQDDADALGLGVEVVYVGLEAIHPPRDGDVAAKFHEQIDARQEKQTAIQEARRVAVQELAEVAGSNEKALQIDAAIQEVVSMQQRLESMRQAGDYDQAKDKQLSDQIAQRKVEVEQLLDAAGGSASSLIYDARAYRWEHALSERARAMRTESRFYAYQQAPKYYKFREYLKMLGESLAERRKIVLVGDPEVPPVIRIEAQTATSGLGEFGIE